MESICPVCKKAYDGIACANCTVTDLDVGSFASEGLSLQSQEQNEGLATAFLVDLVSNRKIPITTPRCKVGRDDLNDIVISGDQSISRFHFEINKVGNQYFVQDGRSRHGTFLNGNQITVSEPIHDGDVLKVGVSLFWFVIENAPLQASDKFAPVNIEAIESKELEVSVPNNGAPVTTPVAKASETATSESLPPVPSKIGEETGPIQLTPELMNFATDPAAAAHMSGQVAASALDQSPEAKALRAEPTLMNLKALEVPATFDASLPGGAAPNTVAKNGARPTGENFQYGFENYDFKFSNPVDMLTSSDLLTGDSGLALNETPPDSSSQLEATALDTPALDSTALEATALDSTVVDVAALKTESGKTPVADTVIDIDAAVLSEDNLHDAPADEANTTAQAEVPVVSDATAAAEVPPSPEAISVDGIDAIPLADTMIEAPVLTELLTAEPADGAAESANVDDKSAEDKSEVSNNSEGKEESTTADSLELEEDVEAPRLDPIAGLADTLVEMSVPVTTIADSLTATPDEAENELAKLFQPYTKAEQAENASLAEHTPTAEDGLADEHAPAAQDTPAAEDGSAVEDEATDEAGVENDSDENNKKSSDPAPAAIFSKLAEIVEASDHKKVEPSATPRAELIFQSETAETPDNRHVSHAGSLEHGEKRTSNGANGMSIMTEASSSTIPDWCKKFFSSELNQLSKELSELNESVRLAQQKIKEVESRVALTKGMRNTLLTAQGDELVEACGKVLTMLGWKVKITPDDKNELRLESNDSAVSIARIVWTETQADRSHLGQLSISQTRYWCEQGVEPKGILIVAKQGTEGPSSLSQNDHTSELAEYASKKNVCLMTTLQLLAVYKEVALKEGSSESVRAAIASTNGWLNGYILEPGAESSDDSSSTNKLSSLLSA